MFTSLWSLYINHCTSCNVASSLLSSLSLKYVPGGWFVSKCFLVIKSVQRYFSLMGACCDKDKESQRTRKVHRKIFVVNTRWKTGRQLGKGGYGKVYQVFDMYDNYKPFAMKTEHLRPMDTCGRLPQEAMVMEEFASQGRTRHVPLLIDKGQMKFDGSKPLQYIVMTLLGPSLSEIRKMCKEKHLSSPSVANIGIQALEAIEDIHTIGFVHRDIKPGNFMIGINGNKHVIYVIDFGMARKIFDANGYLLKRRKDVPFRGTTRYCASDSHQGMEYGRHTDLWCLFNSLIELRKGELPWQHLEGNTKAVFEIKHKIIPQRWLQDIEPQYLTVYESLTSLHYDMTPRYEELRELFAELLKEIGATMNTLFEWEDGHPKYKKFSKELLMHMFHENE